MDYIILLYPVLLASSLMIVTTLSNPINRLYTCILLLQ